MATRRISEAIWIEGKSYWQIKVQKNGIRKAFTSSLKGRKGKHEAEAKADTWLESGTTDMRFEDAWAQFLAYQMDHNGSSNYENLEIDGRLRILPQLRMHKLSKITPAMWQRCIDNAAASGLSRRTCLNLRQSISAFVTFARRNRWTIETLEKGDLRIPNNATPQKQKNVLQPADLQTLFTADTCTRGKQVEFVHYIHAFRFLTVTGLRRGELCGLRREDVRDGILTVSRSINSYNEITSGKNDNARRVIVLPKIAQRILTDQSLMLRRAGIISPWLFPDPDGECTDPKIFYERWDRYRKQHGIASTLHELRHTFVSANKADMPLELLKGIVGHSVSMDTIGIYGHEIDGEKLRAAGIVDDVFGRLLGGSK